MLTAIDTEAALPDHVPTFRDGYRVAEVVDTIQQAADSGTWQTITYRDNKESR